MASLMKFKCVVYNFYREPIDTIHIDPSTFIPHGTVYGVLNQGRHVPDIEIKHAENALIRSANNTLINGARYEIRKGAHCDFERKSSMAWVSDSNMQMENVWDDIDSPFIDRTLGCYIVRRLCAMENTC